MKTGMLWHHETSLAEDTTKQLENLITKAAEDYHRWYGVKPSVCYMNPEELGNHRRRLLKLNMQLSPSDQLAPGQFWLGQ
jgi:hypothetical protein